MDPTITPDAFEFASQVLGHQDGTMMKLYVGNLPFSATDSSLEGIFAEYGSVQSAKVITDRETGRSRGFGFIEIDDDAGRQAIETMHGKEIDGRAIVVNEARPREARPPRY